MTTWTTNIVKLGQAISRGVASIKLPLHPMLKHKMEQNVEGAFEAKYEKEQREAAKAGK